MDRYKIIRFRYEGDATVIKRGLTLEEAQAHCRREDTHGEGWFDGYDLDPTPADETVGRGAEYTYERVLAAAHWGYDHGLLFDAKEVLYFFEKPWHYPEVFAGYDTEHFRQN